MFSENSYQKIEDNCKMTFFCSGIINLLFDGKYVRIFCEMHGKIRGMSKMSARMIMLNYRIRGLLFHYKKKCHFAIGLYFLVIVFTEHPASVCENDVNNEKMFARIICQTIE